jgi:hypothetical protein
MKKTNISLVLNLIGAVFFLGLAWFFAASFAVETLQSWWKALGEAYPAVAFSIGIGVWLPMANAKWERKLRLILIVIAAVAVFIVYPMALASIATGPKEIDVLLNGAHLPSFLGLTAKQWLLVSGLLSLNLVGGLCLANFFGQAIRSKMPPRPPLSAYRGDPAKN